jgi:hypothetical protein
MPVDKRLKKDPKLEAEAKRLGDYELNPIVSKITSKLGSFNIIRNARNKRQVDIEEYLK